MSDLISRQAAINEIRWEEEYGRIDTRKAIEVLKGLPSAEPERKMGKWHVEGFNVWCTNCGFHPTAIEVFDYCPSCGAKMEVD